MSDDRAYITRLALGYQISQVLFAALHLKLFTLLEEGTGTTPELAARIKVDESALNRLLTVLVDMKLVERKGDGYRNTGVASRYLVEGVKEYWGNTVHHASNLWAFWENLDGRIRHGTADLPPPAYLEEYPHRLGDYLAAMDEGAAAKAAAIAAAIGIHRFRHMLDVGCGPGSYSMAFCEMNRDLSATLIDIDPSLHTARERVRERGLTDRIACRSCQVLTDPIPGNGYDLVFISNLIHIYDEKDVALLLAKAWRVLAAPGEMVIHDYLLDAGGGHPLFASLFNLTMLVGTPCGRCYSVDELAGIFVRLHATELKTTPIGLGTSLLTARKTAATA